MNTQSFVHLKTDGAAAVSDMKTAWQAKIQLQLTLV